ncbi:hypothetical protein I317_02566 [Kwoniella heveanensis CBS 569]|uniref:Mid2 domain-containing protein n=1 Tax=Kwoniella heveanensis BCC8398 TaxID=1296120 RepID=A0A1B9GRD2_9TREE|nr:hypothetical protein I316_04950 [Kwoniella heveanensis BCC8398]OCF43549.1 hypothetical protein I317_02566 [Kwoniella heveanensis CBS 569]
MHIPHAAVAAALVLIPFALAHEPAVPAYRRHHARAVIDANRPFAPRAGAVIDDGTLASISAHDASASATGAISAAASATASSAAAASPSAVASSAASNDADDDDAAATSAVSSAVDSGVAGGAPSTTLSSSAAISSTSSSAAVETETSTSAALTASSTSSAVEQSTATSADAAPTTVSQIVQSSAINSGTAHSTIVLVTTASRTQTTHTGSATAESAEGEKKSSGIGKTALIAIIVVASVVGLVAIGWTLFRKWKLRPSNRFDKRMNPIDFSPHNDNMDDDFFEKTLQRTASNSSASRQRQELVAELDDPNHVPGVPPHDFTAGTAGIGAGVGAGYNMYNADPYAHAEQYEYDQSYQHPHQQYDHQYPPSAHTQDPQGYATYNGAPSQDQPLNDGYADLQRGGSIGSGSGHGHGQAVSHDQGVYPGELTFPTADQYGLGRPTGGAEGP